MLSAYKSRFVGSNICVLDKLNRWTVRLNEVQSIGTTRELITIYGGHFIYALSFIVIYEFVNSKSSSELKSYATVGFLDACSASLIYSDILNSYLLVLSFLT